MLYGGIIPLFNVFVKNFLNVFVLDLRVFVYLSGVSHERGAKSSSNLE